MTLLKIKFYSFTPVSYYGNNAEFIGTVAELYQVYRAWTVCTFMTRRLIYERVCYTGGKQWQTTPKNLPRMQRTRAIPVA